jgi:hypothetical protein
VYVLTHHARDPLTVKDTTFHFVTDGVASALEQAREAAGGQYLAAGLLDELVLHLACSPSARR